MKCRFYNDEYGEFDLCELSGDKDLAIKRTMKIKEMEERINKLKNEL